MARVNPLLLALVLLLAGCASSPPNGAPGTTSQAPGRTGSLPAPEGTAPAVPDAPAPEVEPAARPDPSVSLALRTESARAAAAGNAARAMDLLERAIRIEPDRAELWLDLAELHLERGDAIRARQLFEKGAALAAGNRSLERRVRALDERIATAAARG